MAATTVRAFFVYMCMALRYFCDIIDYCFMCVCFFKSKIVGGCVRASGRGRACVLHSCFHCNLMWFAVARFFMCVFLFLDEWVRASRRSSACVFFNVCGRFVRVVLGRGLMLYYVWVHLGFCMAGLMHGRRRGEPVSAFR